MADEWLFHRLGDLVEIFDGPHATPAKTAAGPIFLGISNLSNGRVAMEELEHLSEEDYSRWTRRIKPEPGDIVFSYETRLGQAALIPDDLRCCLGRRMGLMRCRANVVDPRFLLYAYLGQEFQEVLRQRTIRGSTVERIALTEMPEFQIRIPPFPEQRAIAAILGALDDKIELNRRMAETLEAIARALFHSWFVAFDPVRAKAQGRDPGLPEHLAALFPASLDASNTPVGWQERALNSLAAINANALRATDPLEFIDYVEISEVTRGEIKNIVRYQRGSEPSRARRKLAHGDTVISTVRPDRGSHFLAMNPSQSLIASTGFAVLSPRKDNWAFVYAAATRRAVCRFLGQLADGGAYPAIRPDAIGRIKVTEPSPTVLNVYERQARPLFERAHHLRQGSRALAALRDILLEKLISGQLRVPTAERAASAIT